MQKQTDTTRLGCHTDLHFLVQLLQVLSGFHITCIAAVDAWKLVVITYSDILPESLYVLCRCINCSPDKRDDVNHIILDYVEPGPTDSADLAALSEIQVDQLLLDLHYGFSATTH